MQKVNQEIIELFEIYLDDVRETLANANCCTPGGLIDTLSLIEDRTDEVSGLLKVLRTKQFVKLG